MQTSKGGISRHVEIRRGLGLAGLSGCVTMKYSHQEKSKEGKAGWGRIQPHGVGCANRVNSEDTAGSLSLAGPPKTPLSCNICHKASYTCHLGQGALK